MQTMLHKGLMTKDAVSRQVNRPRPYRCRYPAKSSQAIYLESKNNSGVRSLATAFQKSVPNGLARSRWLSPHLKAATQHVRTVEFLHPYSTRETCPRATRRQNLAHRRKNFCVLGIPFGYLAGTV